MDQERKSKLELRRDSFDARRTLLVVNGAALGSLAWEQCDEIGRAFRRAAAAGQEFAERGIALGDDRFLCGAEQPLELRRDPFDAERTLIVAGGQVLASAPWRACLEIAASFICAARAGEEYAKANVIIVQDAALIRSGAPFALTDNRKIRDAAFNEAQWDSTARKAMPLAGVPSRREAGTPRLIKDSLLKTGVH